MSTGPSRLPDGPLTGLLRGQCEQAEPSEGLFCQHLIGLRGTYDESARRASHSELAVGMLLAGEGHDVRTVPEEKGRRTADMTACGIPVEVKAFDTFQQRRGRPPRAEHVANKLLDARGQGAIAVIWGPASGLTEAAARAGYDLFCSQCGESGLGRIRSVRLLGRGFDISFRPAAQAPRRTVGPARAGQPKTSPTDVGLRHVLSPGEHRPHGGWAPPKAAHRGPRLAL